MDKEHRWATEPAELTPSPNLSEPENAGSPPKLAEPTSEPPTESETAENDSPTASTPKIPNRPNRNRTGQRKLAAKRTPLPAAGVPAARNSYRTAASELLRRTARRLLAGGVFPALPLTPPLATIPLTQRLASEITENAAGSEKPRRANR